jgi:hypothetical protein
MEQRKLRRAQGGRPTEGRAVGEEREMKRAQERDGARASHGWSAMGAGRAEGWKPRQRAQRVGELGKENRQAGKKERGRAMGLDTEQGAAEHGARGDQRATERQEQAMSRWSAGRPERETAKQRSWKTAEEEDAQWRRKQRPAWKISTARPGKKINSTAVTKILRSRLKKSKGEGRRGIFSFFRIFFSIFFLTAIKDILNHDFKR